MSNDDSKFLSAGMDYVLNAADARDAITKLVRAAASAAGTDMGSFYVLDAQAGVLRPYATYNFPDDYAKACSEVRVGSQCCGRAVLHKAPWIVSDMLTDPLFAEAREGAMKSGIRAGYSLPVLDATGNCVGALAAHFKTPHTPTHYDLERQSLFAKLIAFAFARAGNTVTKAAGAVPEFHSGAAAD